MGYGISDARGYVLARKMREAKPKPFTVVVVRGPEGELFGAIVEGVWFGAERSPFDTLRENPFEADQCLECGAYGDELHAGPVHPRRTR
jgi:hypothetical protein